MTPLPLHKGLYGRPAPYPEACEPLEEVGAAQPADAAAALAFAMGRTFGTKLLASRFGRAPFLGGDDLKDQRHRPAIPATCA